MAVVEAGYTKRWVPHIWSVLDESEVEDVSRPLSGQG